MDAGSSCPGWIAMDWVRWSVFACVCLIAAADPAAGQSPPAEPPAEYGPVSINMEDVPYPHPVEYMPLSLFGKDVRMAYMDVPPAGAGNGRTAFLLHGLNFFGEYWAGTIDALTQAGFRVVAVDQVGFGRSSKPIIPYALGDHAANTRRLLDHLELDEVAVVGHSFGGMLATRFALSYPDVTSHLVLVNQIGLTDARLTRPWRYTDEIYEANLGRDYAAIRANFERYYVDWRPEFERHIRIHYGWTLSGEWPRLAMVRALNQQIIFAEPVVYDWPHIEVPTLVLGGAVDGPDFPAQAERVAETIPGAEILLFPDVGHNPHLEAPELFHPALASFLGDGTLTGTSSTTGGP